MSTDLQAHCFSTEPTPITDWAPPAQVRIPLVQHQGKPAPVIVNTGQTVEVGDPLSHSESLFEVPVHASITGVVERISEQQITLRNIETTNTGDQPRPSSPYASLSEARPPEARQSKNDFTNLAFDDWPRDQFIAQIHSAGLVGLGGSCFPVAAKINKLNGCRAEVLLINAAECDPLICCDEALLNQSIEDIATGICLAQYATDAKKTIIGVEYDKREQGHSLLKCVLEHCAQQYSGHTELQFVPARYPNGAESLLMSHCLGQSLTPVEIQDSKLVTFNIGTCYSLSQALIHNKPSTHRITTVVDSNHNKVNLRLPLGTPISDLAAQYEKSSEHRIFVGGEMMGNEVSSCAVVTKASNCIQLKHARALPSVRPCVRCGLCVEACPVNLMPQFLLSASTAANSKHLQTLNLQTCIECACCDRVCPSHIPLASIFANSKKVVDKDIRSRQLAELAKSRFEKRQARLENSKQREFRKLDKKQSTLNQDEKTGQQAKRQLVEEALQRARNKKLKNTSSPASNIPSTASKDKRS